VTATRTDTASPRPAAGGPGGRPGRYLREIISELRRSCGPRAKELTTYTIVVIVFVVIMVALVARAGPRARQSWCCRFSAERTGLTARRSKRSKRKKKRVRL